MKYRGNPIGLQKEILAVKEYMELNELTPKSSGYNVLIENKESNDFAIDIYFDV